MHIAVSAFVENEANEVLLVKTHARSDTWEFPGGGVEEKELLSDAVCREVQEETGIIVSPIGVTGVYQNLFANVLCVVFRARYLGGTLQKQEEEIEEVGFVKLTEQNARQYITRPNFFSRYQDAIRSQIVSCETWQNHLDRLSRC